MFLMCIACLSFMYSESIFVELVLSQLHYSSLILGNSTSISGFSSMKSRLIVSCISVLIIVHHLSNSTFFTLAKFDKFSRFSILIPLIRISMTSSVHLVVFRTASVTDWDVFPLKTSMVRRLTCRPVVSCEDLWTHIKYYRICVKVHVMFSIKLKCNSHDI